jgi:hypothetical protein
MSKLSKEDFDMLYWHASSKMRHGEFRSATQFFRYLFDEKPVFHIGMAFAYCAYRDGEKQYAGDILGKFSPTTPQEERLYERLLRRVMR